MPLRARVGRTHVHQFAVLDHAAALQIAQPQRALATVLDVLDLQTGCRRRGGGVLAERLVQTRQEARPPFVEGAEEVATGIRLAALGETRGAGPGESGVDPLGNRLIGARPLPVAAAEHREARTGQRALRQAFDRRDELAGVVGRLAFVGCRDHDDRALARQVGCIVVHGRHGRREAVGRRLVGDAVGEGLRRTGVAAIEDQQRRGSRIRGGPSRRLRRQRLLRRRWHGTAPQRSSRAARPRADAQPLGLERQRLMDLQRVGRIVEHEIEALQHQDEDELGFLHGEGPADAGPRAIAEGLPGIRRQLAGILGREPLGPEGFHIVAPDLGVAMQHRLQDHHDVLGRERVLAGEHRVLVRADGEHRGGRPDAQRLHQDLLDVAQLRQVLDPRHLLAQHLVDERPRLLQHVRILEQQIGREGQKSARGFVAGDQEGNHLIADVLVAQLLTGDGIDAVEHQVEQVVLLVALRIAPALGDEVARDLVHHLLVDLELARLGQHEAAQQLRPAGAVRGFLQRSHHGGHEGMHVVLVEAVEAVVERAQGDRVEREPRHVVGDLDDGARAEPLPAHEHLVGNVEHPVEHAADRDRSEGRDQDAMRLGPIGLVAIGGEQPVAGNRPDLLQGPLDTLAESRLVAQFVHQLL